MHSQKFLRAAARAIETCLGMKKQENLLIVAHDAARGLGELFYAAALDITSDICLLHSSSASLQDEPIEALVKTGLHRFRNAILLHPHVSSLTLPAMFLSAENTRLLCVGTAAQQTFARWMRSDVVRLQEHLQKIADLLTIGKTMAIRSHSGTELQLDISKRKAVADTQCDRGAGHICFLPPGEVCIQPGPGGQGGRVMMNHLAGQPPEANPVELVLKKGAVVQVRGAGDTAGAVRKFFRRTGPTARRIAGVSVGLNPDALFGRLPIEDRKVLGAVTVTLGEAKACRNLLAELLLSGVLRKASVSVDNRPLLDNGRLLFT